MSHFSRQTSSRSCWNKIINSFFKSKQKACVTEMYNHTMYTWIGSIPTGSWCTGEERPVWQARGRLQPWRRVRIRRRSTLFPKRRRPTKLSWRPEGLPWRQYPFPCWTQSWSTFKEGECKDVIQNELPNILVIKLLSQSLSKKVKHLLVLDSSMKEFVIYDG